MSGRCLRQCCYGDRELWLEAPSNNLLGNAAVGCYVTHDLLIIQYTGVSCGRISHPAWFIHSLVDLCVPPCQSHPVKYPLLAHYYMRTQQNPLKFKFIHEKQRDKHT